MCVSLFGVHAGACRCMRVSLEDVDDGAGPALVPSAAAACGGSSSRPVPICYISAVAFFHGPPEGCFGEQAAGAPKRGIQRQLYWFLSRVGRHPCCWRAEREAPRRCGWQGCTSLLPRQCPRVASRIPASQTCNRDRNLTAKNTTRYRPTIWFTSRCRNRSSDCTQCACILFGIKCAASGITGPVDSDVCNLEDLTKSSERRKGASHL